VLAASYFAELCDLATEPMHPVPEMFSLLQRAWTYLREKAPEQRGLLHFETELAKVLGIHDPSVTAYRSLGDLLHTLPESRDRVMKILERA
jgi:DNA repair protein RecO (recombination protein O)